MTSWSLTASGDRKTAVFFTISDTTPTYNFIVALAFSQMFNLLCERADNVHGGRLPAACAGAVWDEAANTGPGALAGEAGGRDPFPRGESVPVLPAVRAVQGHLQR